MQMVLVRVCFSQFLFHVVVAVAVAFACAVAVRLVSSSLSPSALLEVFLSPLLSLFLLVFHSFVFFPPVSFLSPPLLFSVCPLVAFVAVLFPCPTVPVFVCWFAAVVALGFAPACLLEVAVMLCLQFSVVAVVVSVFAVVVAVVCCPVF